VAIITTRFVNCRKLTNQDTILKNGSGAWL